ncbi:hypothetical protein RJ640_000611 [Escallonia rubra]|uniref:Protein kinase domain-containing protein n=1 Tax=Escallonia rubra TaxID=112253 RepID=A0AA88QJI8_9ASTE|nr:hypothetical protein RJ640_000611 [Escallonia rubra]
MSCHPVPVLAILLFIVCCHVLILAGNSLGPFCHVNKASARYASVDKNLPGPYPASPVRDLISSAPRLQRLVLARGRGNVIATGLTVVMALLNIVVYKLRQLQEANICEKIKSSSTSREEPRQCFSFAEIRAATNDFDDTLVIGKGGFGRVYKGLMDDGAKVVAIKRLNSKSRQGGREFWTEIEMLSKFRHCHLVSLVGYCSKGQEMILVYEYMPQGTLADHLYKTVSRTGNSPLSWVQRLKICIGAARGLEYLHTGIGVQHRVIHRDVKSSNILLDENCVAKISDFGLSKLGPANQSFTHVSTNVKGTFGYLDPEYYLTRRLTRMSDVYAFGVVLFEVLCGRPAVDLTVLDEKQISLALWAKYCIKKGTVNGMTDLSLRGQISASCLQVFTEIASKCLRSNPSKRPVMAEVVARLESVLALQENRRSSLDVCQSIVSADAADDGEEITDTSVVEEEVINVFGHSGHQYIEINPITQLGDAKKTLTSPGDQCFTVSKLAEEEDDEVSEIGQFNLINENVLNWVVETSMGDCSSKEANAYWKTVCDVRRLVEGLESLNLGKDVKKNMLLQEVLGGAMTRIELEFRRMLADNLLPPSYRKEDILDEGLIVSRGKVAVAGVFQRDLVHPDVISDLRCIANLMFDLNHGKECSQAFICIRKEALQDRLSTLRLGKLNNEDALSTERERDTLEFEIRQWIHGMRVFVKVYLPREKWLTDQIFGELESVSSVYFAELSRASIVEVLNFGKAIDIDHHKPGSLFCVIHMYEVLVDLVLDIDALYSDETGSCVKAECQGLLRRLGDCARAVFFELENAIRSEKLKAPIPGGTVRPLTKYVMMYFERLTDQGTILNLLLKDHGTEVPNSFMPDTNEVNEYGSSVGSLSSIVSPMALHLRSLTSLLESNLKDMSKLYKADSLRQLFLMNNVHYMAQKVKESKLEPIFGNEWVRKHNWEFQRYAMNYERATWCSVLSFLKDDDSLYSDSRKTLLRERLRSFYVAFEDVYKKQTGWSVPDFQLREDLQLSIGLNVVHAYRSFVGLFAFHIGDKHIKYSPDDLQDYIFDLFEGCPQSLRSVRRK